MPIATPDQYNMCFKVSDSGRDVLKDMMAAHHFYDSSFSPDPYQTAFNEGERNVILRILTILDAHKKEEKVDGRPDNG